MRALFACVLTWLALHPLTSNAQQTVPPIKVEYLDSTFAVLPSAQGAFYRRETEYKDSVGGEVRDYFLSGKLQSRCLYEHIRNAIVHGTFQNWYENGTTEWYQEFKHGVQNGITKQFYPNGKLKRYELYASGKRTLGKLYDVNGKQIKFVEYKILPTYEGGVQKLLQDIKERTVYPEVARRQFIEGKVIVAFVVDKNGAVKNLRIVESISPLLNDAAMDAVRKLDLFTPGKIDGVPVEVYYTVPITFQIF